jgi:hypothetical protein
MSGHKRTKVGEYVLGIGARTMRPAASMNKLKLHRRRAGAVARWGCLDLAALTGLNADKRAEFGPSWNQAARCPLLTRSPSLASKVRHAVFRALDG